MKKIEMSPKKGVNGTFVQNKILFKPILVPASIYGDRKNITHFFN